MIKHKNTEPSYYGILPANVRYDNRLKPMEKILYCEISALSNKTGECWSTNKYFADLYDVTTVTVSTWVSDLVKLGYINRRIKYAENSKQIIGRYLSILSGGIKENINTPLKEKVKDNNTSISITSINKVELVLPQNINPSSWENWLNYRKEIKKRMTPMSIKKQLTLLSKYSYQEQQEMIDQSIQNGWTGLFPSKDKRPNTVKSISVIGKI